VIGNHRIGRHQILGLAYLGYVPGQLQHHLPAVGTLVRAGERPCRVKLTSRYKEVRSMVAVLRAWSEESTADAPPVILNKHCPECPYRVDCYEQAEREDNLSLLDRMTPRLLRKYHQKGVFTLTNSRTCSAPDGAGERPSRPCDTAWSCRLWQ
jgi:hypothetical protein